ncbi:MAG: tetratricopeptide repeat protein [Blastocatellales bacterium]
MNHHSTPLHPPVKTRLQIALALCLLIFALTEPARTFAIKESWTKVVSANFVVVSDSSEKEAIKVAAMLEQFRYTASLLFPKTKVKAPVPTKVYLFRSHGSFRPFKPKYKGKIRNDANGYFFGAGDHSFIALTTEAGGGRGYEVIFHEYQHFILSANMPHAPLWLDEGLAEYYSTFDPRSEGRDVLLGGVVHRHVQSLRKAVLMPLEKLFSIDPKSREYSQANKAGLFYAQSWALSHYLMQGNGGKRQPQFARFISLLGEGKPVEESFRQSFQADYKTIEKELQSYIANFSFPARVYSFPEQIGSTKDARIAALSEAEVEFHLGELLLNSRRYDEAELRLVNSVRKDANCADCQIALGALRFRQHKYAEAKERLQTGLTLDPQNYRGLHVYANLSREEGSYDDAIKTYSRALGVNPNLANIHLDLSFAYLASGQQRKSDEEFDQARKLSALGDAYYRARSYAALRFGRGAQAASDSLTFIKLKGWQDNSAPYAAMAAYLGYRMDKLSAEAGKTLEEVGAKADAREWPYPIIKYLKREITAQQLISSAKDNDQLTEARAYVGMDLSLNGNRVEAVRNLQWVKEKGNPSFVEYEMAWGELKRIEKARD